MAAGEVPQGWGGLMPVSGRVQLRVVRFVVLLAVGVATVGLAIEMAVTDPQPSLRHPAIIITARAFVAFWAAAVSLQLRARPEEWAAFSPRLSLARGAWTIGLVVHLVHVGFAFGLGHGWSHTAAVRHVEEVGGFGAGIAVNYLFAAVWTADVIWWCASPGGYAHRPRWIGYAVHSFLAFTAFNATVVFGSGPVRVAGGAAFAMLAGLLWARRARII
jgi:hypothetical protein